MTSVPFADDPVWTPLIPETGVPWFDQMTGRRTLAACQGLFPGRRYARWDAEQPGWIIAPAVPVEVTGVPNGWAVRNKQGNHCTTTGSLERAWKWVDLWTKTSPINAPFLVEACIPVPRNEEAK